MRDEFLRPDCDEFGARGQEIPLGMHTPRHPDDPDSAFFRMLHVAGRVGDKYEITGRRAARLISFSIGRRTGAADEIGLIRQKALYDGALVRLDVAPEDMGKAMSDVRSRQETPYRGRRV